MKKSMIAQCPSLKDSQILSDEMMEGIESGGSCKETCKKKCVTNIGPGPFDDSDDVKPINIEDIEKLLTK